MKKYLLILLFISSYLEIFSIQHIRWGTNSGPLDGLTITWQNSGWADKINWGYTPSLEMGISSGIRRSGYTGNFYNFTFPSVTPNSTIYYKLFDSNTNSWTSEKTFATAAPANTSSITFCVLGDSRNGIAAWNQISNLANSERSDLTLFNGDIVDNGGSGSQWDNWFNSGSAFLENNLVLHALGNHDAMSVPTYQNNFELPEVGGSNLYYSVTYGNAIFITLNSENPSSSSQATWLVNTLSAASANPNIVWKIVSFHKPFYTIGSHAGEMNSYFNTWWKAFDDYGVDLIVNGHDHMYERTKPINRNVSTTSAVSTYGSLPGQGRCQIVCGGAGAPLYGGTPTWAIEAYESKYNFCRFKIDGSVLTNITYDDTGAIIDQFTIDKTNISTGIGESAVKGQVFNEMKVYPNPIADHFKLEYSSELSGEATIKIFDMMGREVLSQKVLKEAEKLEFDYDMSSFASGVYTLQVVLGRQKDSQLIILK